MVRQYGFTLSVMFILDASLECVFTDPCSLLSYLALKTQKPMILLFAGPSGHGKTELARQLGSLISLDLLTVDCTKMHSAFDLWGPVKPYAGYADGSKLNNFLAEHSGRRSIVFMDEFEKMDQEVRNTLLLPFQEGKRS